MAAGSIVIDLLARTGGFSTDIARSEKQLRQFKKEAVDAGKAIGGAFLAFTAAGTALAAFAKQTIDGIDALNDVADATGASIENISALEDVALRTGASLQTVASLLTKFNLVLKDGDPTKGPGAVLKSLNLDINELKKLDPAEALRRTAVALAGFADDGNKARAVQELFGRSVAEVAPLLKDLADQTKLVGTVTKEQSDQAEIFNKNLFALEANVRSLGRSLVSDLVPALNELIQRFKDGAAEGKGFFEVAFDNYKKDVRKFYEGIGLLSAEKIPFPQFATSPAGGGRGFVNPALVKPSLNIPESPDKPDRSRGSRGPKPQDLFGDYLKTLQRQLEATQELTSLETVLRDVQLGRLGSVSTKQLDALKNIAGEIDASKQFAAIEKEFAAAEKDSLARKKELADAGRAVYEATRTPLEQLNIEQTKLNELLRLGAINADTFARATFALDETLGRVKEVGKELDTFAKTAAKNIQGAIGDGLVDILDGNFKDIGKSFTSLINRMVAEAAAAQIARSLFGGLVEGGSGSGILGGILSGIGNAFGFGASKASGGDVMANRSYLVGEQGPEMFVPRTMGAIVPNAALAGGGGSTTNNYVTVAMPQGGSRATALQFGTDAARQISRANSRNG
ncbi:MAG: hypothetical protein V4794_19470 [Pseudomonadota bacterium]